MNNDKIIEGNKLIAFSDFSSEDIHEWVHSMDSTPSDNFCSKVLNYHEKWEMLMPVVEKIEGMERKYDEDSKITHHWRVEITRHSCYIPHCFIEKGKELFIDAHSKIEAVWLAVVEFINWYNQKKEQ